VIDDTGGNFSVPRMAMRVTPPAAAAAPAAAASASVNVPKPAGSPTL
jgi:hypothetical protein